MYKILKKNKKYQKIRCNRIVFRVLRSQMVLSSFYSSTPLLVSFPQAAGCRTSVCEVTPATGPASAREVGGRPDSRTGRRAADTTASRCHQPRDRPPRGPCPAPESTQTLTLAGVPGAWPAVCRRASASPQPEQQTPCGATRWGARGPRGPVSLKHWPVGPRLPHALPAPETPFPGRVRGWAARERSAPNTVHPLTPACEDQAEHLLPAPAGTSQAGLGWDPQTRRSGRLGARSARRLGVSAAFCSQGCGLEPRGRLARLVTC